MQQVVEGSPRPTARTIAVVYLLYFLTGIFGALLMKGLVVPTDALATAQNLLAHESLYRSGWEAGLVANALYIAVTALFYGLLAPVNRSLAMMMAFFSLVGCTIQIFGYLIYKSTFLPRFIGVWFMIAGVVGLTFLWPPLAIPLRFVIIPVGGIAEVVLMLWLIVKGVDVSRWREKAGAPLPIQGSGS